MLQIRASFLQSKWLNISQHTIAAHPILGRRDSLLEKMTSELSLAGWVGGGRVDRCCLHLEHSTCLLKSHKK